jgi:hypothetical protein
MKPALAAATAEELFLLDLMYNLVWQSVTCGEASGDPSPCEESQC